MREAFMDMARWDGFILPLIFLIRYTMLTRWGWRHNMAGRTIVAFDCLMIIGFGAASFMPGSSGGPDTILDTCVFFLMGMVVLWRIIALEVGSKKRKRARIGAA